MEQHATESWVTHNEVLQQTGETTYCSRVTLNSPNRLNLPINKLFIKCLKDADINFGFLLFPFYLSLNFETIGG